MFNGDLKMTERTEQNDDNAVSYTQIPREETRELYEQVTAWPVPVR